MKRGAAAERKNAAENHRELLAVSVNEFFCPHSGLFHYGFREISGVGRLKRRSG
ncbi:MAG: hypothetical protein ACI4JZ_10070 [Oscillospiraceae bacterium]